MARTYRTGFKIDNHISKISFYDIKERLPEYYKYTIWPELMKSSMVYSIGDGTFEAFATIYDEIVFEIEDEVL